MDNLVGPPVKFCGVSALPSDVLAFSDNNWRSSDAASKYLVEWIEVRACFWPIDGEICPFGVALPVFPLVLSDLIAYAADAQIANR
jgi:hypothetical protein